MRQKRPYPDMKIVTIALGGTTSTVNDETHLFGHLMKVQAKIAADANVTGVKVELQRYSRITVGDTTPGWVSVYIASNAAIADDNEWHNCDADKDLEVPLSLLDGQYRWKATANAATAAEMLVYIRRIVMC